MRGLLIAWIATCGCSFRASPASPDDASVQLPDAPGERDAATTTDAPVSSPACVVTATGSASNDAGIVGGTRGSLDAGQTLTCSAPTDLVVGVDVDMSNGNTSNGGRSALALAIYCAPLTVTGGTGTVGSAYSRVATGNGNGGWSPATWGQPAMCPSNAVLTGLDVHAGGNQEIFQNVTITCTAIDHAGGATGSQSSVYVMGSLTDTQSDSSASCDVGDTVREVVPTDGDGIDAIDLHCGATACGSAT